MLQAAESADFATDLVTRAQQLVTHQAGYRHPCDRHQLARSPVLSAPTDAGGRSRQRPTDLASYPGVSRSGGYVPNRQPGCAIGMLSGDYRLARLNESAETCR